MAIHAISQGPIGCCRNVKWLENQPVAQTNVIPLVPRQDIHNSELPVLCRSCEARHQGICGTLTPDQLIELSRHTQRKTIAAGTQFTSEGEDKEIFANVLTGVVKLSKGTRDGRQQIVGLQFAPDLVGRPFSKRSDSSVTAATEVRLCSFPRSTLEKIIARNPDLEHRIHQQSARELEDAHDWLLTLGRKGAGERVASFLVFIARHQDPEHEDPNVRTFELPLSRAEIADFLGLTIETVSRQITRLRQKGVIHVSNKRTIEVADMARLEALCELDRP